MYHYRWLHPPLWGRTAAPAPLQPLRVWLSVRWLAATGPITASREPLWSCTGPQRQTCGAWCSRCLTRSAVGPSLLCLWPDLLTGMVFTSLETSLEQVRTGDLVVPGWMALPHSLCDPFSCFVPLSTISHCIHHLLSLLHRSDFPGGLHDAGTRSGGPVLWPVQCV